MRTSYIKWGLVLAVFVSFLMVIAANRDPDLGWHLAVGELILDHGAIQRADIWSYTMPGLPWVDHEWALNAALAWMNRRDLWSLVLIGFALIAAAPFAFWIRRARSFWELAAIGLIAVATMDFLGVRPQVLSFALFAFLASFLGKTFVSEPRPSRLRPLFVAGFFFLWANLHAGFAVGLVLYAIFVGTSWIAAFRAKSGERYGFALSETCIVAAVALATAVNPFGFGLHREVLSVMTSGLTARYILEWQPALEFSTVKAMVLAGLYIFLLARYWRRYPLPLSLASLFFFISFMRSVRMAPLFFVTLVPIVGLAVGLVRNEMAEQRARTPEFDVLLRKRLRLGKYWIGIVLAAYWIATVIAYPTWQGKYPEAAAQFVKAEAARGVLVRLFNEYGWGGYLIRAAPEIRTFIDGRMPHWVDASGYAAMQDYVDLYYGTTTARDAVVGKWHITHALIQRQKVPVSFAARIARRLPQKVQTWLHERAIVQWFSNLGTSKTNEPIRDYLAHRGWAVAYEDAVGVVFRCAPPECAP